jgi:hypothetical protein
MADGNNSAQADRYETIKVETSGRVGLVHLHRPKNLNALNAQLSHELLDSLRSFDQYEAIGAMIVTGSERAFAAGADIEEMARKTPVQLRAENYSERSTRSPGFPSPSSPPYPAMLWAVVASSPCSATSSLRPRALNSANPRSSSGSCRASADRSASRARSENHWRWS